MAASSSGSVDRRNIMRGRCLVDECDCDKFLSLETSVFCGYCNDPPTKHEHLGKADQSSPTTSSLSTRTGVSNSCSSINLDTVDSTDQHNNGVDQQAHPTTSDSLPDIYFVTGAEPSVESGDEQDISQFEASPKPVSSRSTDSVFTKLRHVPTTCKPWENTDLGWINNPQRESGQFYNSVMLNFYKAYWPSCHGAVTSFRAAFILERKREWEEVQFVRNMEKTVSFLTSDNMAAAGRFISPYYTPKRNDLYGIERIGKTIEDVRLKIEDNLNKVKAFHETLFVERADGSPGLKLKAGRGHHYNFDKKIIDQMNTLNANINQVIGKLNDAKELVIETFKLSARTSSSRSVAKRKYNNDWKTKQRQKESKQQKAEELFEQLGGKLVGGHLYDPECGAYQITEVSQDQLQNVTWDTTNMNALETLFQASVFRESALEVITNLLFQ